MLSPPYSASRMRRGGRSQIQAAAQLRAVGGEPRLRARRIESSQQTRQAGVPPETVTVNGSRKTISEHIQTVTYAAPAHLKSFGGKKEASSSLDEMRTARICLSDRWE